MLCHSIIKVSLVLIYFDILHQKYRKKKQSALWRVRKEGVFLCVYVGVELCLITKFRKIWKKLQNKKCIIKKKTIEESLVSRVAISNHIFLYKLYMFMCVYVCAMSEHLLFFIFLFIQFGFASYIIDGRKNEWKKYCTNFSF